MSDGEIEEDIMDISRSDIDEAEPSTYSPKAMSEVQDTSGLVDEDENYEPPSQISIIQRQEPHADTFFLHEGLGTGKAVLPAETQDQQPSSDQSAEPTEEPTSGEPSSAASVILIGDRQSLSRSPSLANASDPDDYEPPEPAPLGQEVPRPTRISSVADSENSSSPPKVQNDDVAHASSGSVPAVRQKVSGNAISVEVGSSYGRYRRYSLMLANAF